MILVLGLVWAVSLVLLAGGDVRRLGRISLKYESAILLLFVAQGIARADPLAPHWRTGALTVWGVGGMIILRLLTSEKKSGALALVATGLALNLLVVLANQGMPVTMPSATLAAAALNGGFYHQASRADVLLVLADVVPLPGGWMLSLGDLLVATGVISFTAHVCLSSSMHTRAT